jgi:hypothetical protein
MSARAERAALRDLVRANMANQPQQDDPPNQPPNQPNDEEMEAAADALRQLPVNALVLEYVACTSACATAGSYAI